MVTYTRTMDHKHGNVNHNYNFEYLLHVLVLLDDFVHYDYNIELVDYNHYY